MPSRRPRPPGAPGRPRRAGSVGQKLGHQAGRVEGVLPLAENPGPAQQPVRSGRHQPVELLPGVPEAVPQTSRRGRPRAGTGAASAGGGKTRAGLAFGQAGRAGQQDLARSPGPDLGQEVEVALVRGVQGHVPRAGPTRRPISAARPRRRPGAPGHVGHRMPAWAATISGSRRAAPGPPVLARLGFGHGPARAPGAPRPGGAAQDRIGRGQPGCTPGPGLQHRVQLRPHVAAQRGVELLETRSASRRRSRSQAARTRPGPRRGQGPAVGVHRQSSRPAKTSAAPRRREPPAVAGLAGAKGRGGVRRAGQVIGQNVEWSCLGLPGSPKQERGHPQHQVREEDHQVQQADHGVEIGAGTPGDVRMEPRRGRPKSSWSCPPAGEQADGQGGTP